MPIEVFDEKNLRSLPDEERFSECEHTLKNDPDESKRWDSVWLVGELAENKDESDSMFNRVAELITWVLRNEDNGVVKHEACFQIAARNMRERISELVNVALYDKSTLAKHEAIESLGLMRAFEVKDLIEKALDDPSPDVKETAAFVLKRFERMKGLGTYEPSQIL